MGMGGAVPRVRVASVAFGTTADGLGIEFYFSVERRRRLAVERSSSCQFSAITVRAFELLLRASVRAFSVLPLSAHRKSIMPKVSYSVDTLCKSFLCCGEKRNLLHFIFLDLNT